VPAPSALRRFLRFARLPVPALDIARKVLDEDDEFRARVATAVTEEEVGPAGWLWLNRPEGWEAKVEALRREATEREAAAEDERSERDARKRLAGAEAAARRAEAAAQASAAEAGNARAALAAEQAARRQAEGEVARLAQQVASVVEERTTAVRRLKDVEADLAARSADLKRAQHQVRMLEAELHQDPAEAVAPAADAVATPALAAPDLDRLRLADLVDAASRAAADLAKALGAAASLIGPIDDGVAPAERAPRHRPEGSGRGAASSPRREPVRLPAGVFDDTAEAAAHLVRLRGAVVVVDGYNVSLTAWPDRPLPEQRQRLVDALCELHARTGAHIDVVFDGATTEGPPSPGSRPGVRVRFSPPGVEADDVVIGLVSEQPLNRPVVVASSDRRVQDGARRNGANVVSSRQLLGALQRSH
jgi:predicted RNA-binding protein with PIN domain